MGSTGVQRNMGVLMSLDGVHLKTLIEIINKLSYKTDLN